MVALCTRVRVRLGALRVPATVRVCIDQTFDKIRIESGPRGRSSGRGPAGQFTVRAQARDYLFGVDESAEADAWVAEIEKAIQAVVAGMAQAGMAPVSVQ